MSYSSKWEIINAIKQIVKDGVSEEDINEKMFSQYLTTKGVPNPELLIRTSGEQRISNFYSGKYHIQNYILPKNYGQSLVKKIFMKLFLNFKKRKKIWKNIRTIKRTKIEEDYIIIVNFMCNNTVFTQSEK